MTNLLTPSLNWLLVFIPIAGYLEFFTKSHTAIFICSCLAIIAIAGWMVGSVNEPAHHLGMRTDFVGIIVVTTISKGAEHSEAVAGTDDPAP